MRYRIKKKADNLLYGGNPYYIIQRKRGRFWPWVTMRHWEGAGVIDEAYVIITFSSIDEARAAVESIKEQSKKDAEYKYIDEVIEEIQ